MLAAVLVIPGGLVLLAAVALAVVLMRSLGGQRLLASLERRIPPRVRAPARRVLACLVGGKSFLSRASAGSLRAKFGSPQLGGVATGTIQDDESQASRERAR